jgi:hypothetical protein
MRKIFLLLAILLPSNAFAGAWLMDEGEGKVITQIRHYYAEKKFDANGNRVANSAYAKWSLNPYAEYGLTDDITIGGQFEADAVDNRANVKNNDSGYSFTSASAFARAKIWQEDKFVSSAEIGLKKPFDSGKQVNPEGKELIPNFKLNVGYGSEDYFFEAAANYLLRSDNNLNNMLKLELGGGYMLTDDFQWLNQLTNERATGNNFTGGNYDLTKVQTSVLYKMSDNVGHQFGVTYDVDGKNTTKGASFNYSIWYSF